MNSLPLKEYKCPNCGITRVYQLECEKYCQECEIRAIIDSSDALPFSPKKFNRMMKKIRGGIKAADAAGDVK